MDTAEYEHSLRLLGLTGEPMGEVVVNGVFMLPYKMPDGAPKFLPPPDRMSPLERAEMIDTLRAHIGQIEQNRRDRAGKRADH